MNGFFKKAIYIHIYIIYNGILYDMEKKKILPFVTTWLDLEDIILSETSQTEVDKHCMMSHICRIL